VARIFVDTNVLFPFSVMDLMLALSEDAVHEVVWSDRLLDEWERVIVREQHRSADAAAAISAAIRTRICALFSTRFAMRPWQLSRVWQEESGGRP
jgi:hypothetical protein